MIYLWYACGILWNYSYLSYCWYTGDILATLCHTADILVICCLKLCYYYNILVIYWLCIGDILMICWFNQIYWWYTVILSLSLAVLSKLATLYCLIHVDIAVLLKLDVASARSPFLCWIFVFPFLYYAIPAHSAADGGGPPSEWACWLWARLLRGSPCIRLF